MARSLVPLLLCLAACSGSATGTSSPETSGKTAAEVAEELAVLTRREHAPQPTHELRLLGGLASATVEARVAPKPECREEGDSKACMFRLEMGQLPVIDEPAFIYCSLTTTPVHFGPILKAAQGTAGLTETPQLTTRSVGAGIAISFVAQSIIETEHGRFPGTVKVAALYTKGYTAVCSDNFVGGRKTFDRVVDGFFAGLRVEDNPQFPKLFAIGYRSRSGDRVDGLRYDMIAGRADGEPGFVEISTAFRLRTDGKTWEVSDWGHAITRDERGTTESYLTEVYADGDGPLLLSAKPSEDGRVRVKSEVGNRSDAIELTPKAPLSTELWSLVEMQKLSTGARESFRYAQPALEDGDPSFNYIELSRLGPRLLGEREVRHGQLGKPKKGDAKSDTFDELHLDERGVVVKEVATDSVVELIHSSGELPAPLTRSAARGRR
jgi:hypothetical protein